MGRGSGILEKLTLRVSALWDAKPSGKQCEVLQWKWGEGKEKLTFWLSKTPLASVSHTPQTLAVRLRISDRKMDIFFPSGEMICPRDFWHIVILTLETFDSLGSPSKVAGFDSDKMAAATIGNHELGRWGPSFYSAINSVLRKEGACPGEHWKEVSFYTTTYKAGDFFLEDRNAVKYSKKIQSQTMEKGISKESQFYYFQVQTVQ